MLEALPKAIWPALCSLIHAGVQQGSIDARALWQLCHPMGRDPSTALPGAEKLWAWATGLQGLPPLQTAEVLFVAPGFVPSEGPNEDAVPADSQTSQLQLPWPHEPPPSPSTAVLKIPCGMPDIVTFALALVARAQTVSTLPALRVHPDLTDASCEALGQSRGRAILGLLAEMGLAGRPWHLWLGPKTPQARLSPYVRDLGEALWRWGETHGLVAPGDAAEPTTVAGRSPIELYRLAEAFVASYGGLAAERSTAERSVGITQARIDGLDVAVIDLSRAVPELWDVRLPQNNPWHHADRAQAPLLVQIDTMDDASDEREHAAMVTRLCLALGVTLSCVTVCKNGLLTREEADHLQASSLLDTTCDRSLPCDGTADDAAACADALPYTLDAVSDAKIWANEPIDEPLAAAARVAGGGHLWARLLRLKHRGVMQKRAPLQLHLVRRHSPVGADAIAIHYLRDLLTRPTPAPAQSEESKTAAAVIRRGRGLRV